LKEKFINILLNSSLVRSNLVISLGRFVRSLSKSNIVEIEGRKMFTQNNDGLALSIFKIYEPNQTKIVKKYVHEGDVVIDVGAHVGYYTLLMAQLVGKNGKVYSFEPDPVNFELLKKSVEINGFENVVLIQKAVSDTTEKIKLFLGDNDSAINRIYDAKLGDAKKSIDVESVTIDEYFKENDKLFNFIKIDSEGSEAKIINGMEKFLTKNRKLIMMTEFFPFLIKKSGDEPKQYLKSLENSGFELYNILDDNKETNKINSESFLKIEPDSEYCTNLLCKKE
jgi:FkbM family methyltransferase|tara:strand:- start:1395 stop:2237 length:843 start_codon:yes stop_codon:yes gene_type:complete